MKVLLSIKPEFVEKIFDGTKKYEYRKQLFKKLEVSTVVVYSTKPVGKIVGEFDIECVLCDLPKNIWKLTKRFSGVEHVFFKTYYAGRKRAVAIKIGALRRYDNPISLSEGSGLSHPPQSFVYINSGRQKELPA